VSTALALVLYVVALWWSATGVILYLNRRPVRTFRWTVAGASSLLLLALCALAWCRDQATVRGACVAFAASVLVWAWLEITFLTGAITGPRRVSCHPGCGGRTHFMHAVQAILYHEVATLAAVAIVLTLGRQAANPTGSWTVLLLWGMRLSAKLNLHFGVPNVAAAMLPPHLHYLLSFFRQRTATPLLLASISCIALLCAWLVNGALDDSGTEFDRAVLTLLAALGTLALIEHVMLALPLRADALWTRKRSPLGRSSRPPFPPGSLRNSVDNELRAGDADGSASAGHPPPETLYRAAGIGGTP
jgi:putative photosynthetic complex assembly protein 2